jgi:hypothetical protein
MPAAENYNGPQIFSDPETGAVDVYLLLFTCPRRECRSTRALVMFRGPEEAQAAE